MHKVFYWLIAAVLIMIGLPFIAVAFCGDCGMGVCFILFFAVNPVFSVAFGIFAGLNVKKLWFSPLVISALFLAGVWTFFSPLEPDFLFYAAFYLAVSAVCMGITALIKKALKK